MPDDRFFEPEIETASRADIEAAQEERLLELLPYAYERSGLIRMTWEDAGVKPADIRSLADFVERAPCIDKQAVRGFRDAHGDPFGGLLCRDLAEVSAVFSSSGTTGSATFFVESWEGGWGPLAASWARGAWGAGLRPGDFALMSGSTYRGPIYQMAQLCGAVPLMTDTMAGDWEQVFPLIERYQPAFAHLVGPTLLTLERLSADHDIRSIFSCFKAVGFGGEPLSAGMRRRLDAWGMSVFRMTSAGDLGVSLECDQHDGCHLWEDCGVFEALDPVGREPVPDGEVGELVSTALDNWAAPLIRYRTDDLVRLTRMPCVCGRTHARQWPVGRKGDEVVVEGRSILPLDVWAAVEDVPETAAGLFQIVRPRRELDELRVRVGYNPSLGGAPADIAERLTWSIQQAVGVVPRIELMPEEELLLQARAHKLPRVVRA